MTIDLKTIVSEALLRKEAQDSGLTAKEAQALEGIKDTVMDAAGSVKDYWNNLDLATRDRLKASLVGAGLGATAGGVIGGPPGAVIGGALGVGGGLGYDAYTNYVPPPKEYTEEELQEMLDTPETLFEIINGVKEGVFTDKDIDYAAQVELPGRYKGLEYSREFRDALKNRIDDIKAVVDGVGSASFPGYKYFPNTIRGVDITPASDIHDYDYSYPKEFTSAELADRARRIADDRFERNILALIESAGDEDESLYEKRKRSAAVYANLLRAAGKDAFMEGKTILPPPEKTASDESVKLAERWIWGFNEACEKAKVDPQELLKSAKLKDNPFERKTA